MLNQYPLWKNLLVALVLLVGLLYALPNIYSQDPVIEVTGARGEQVGETLQQNLLAALERAQIQVKSSELKVDRLQIRFTTAEDQLAGQDVVAKALPPEFTHAMTLSPDVPGWLAAIGGAADESGPGSARRHPRADRCRHGGGHDQGGRAVCRQHPHRYCAREASLRHGQGARASGVEVRFNDAETA